METQFGDKNKVHVCLYEAIGTGLLVMSVNLSKDGGHLQLPAIMFMLLADIMIFGPVSGGHMNPAVTLGVLVGYIGMPGFGAKACFSMLIMLSQIFGSICGVGLIWIISTLNETNMTIHPTPALLCPGHQDNGKGDINDLCDGTGLYASMFLVEAIGTFIFVGTVLSIIYSTVNNKFAGAIIIVFVLGAACACAGPVSGGAINPAVGIGQQLFQHFMV